MNFGISTGKGANCSELEHDETLFCCTRIERERRSSSEKDLAFRSSFDISATVVVVAAGECCCRRLSLLPNGTITVECSHISAN